MPVTKRHTDSGKQSRNNPAVPIRKNSTQQNAAGIRIEAVIERLDVTLVWKVSFIGELKLNRDPPISVSLQFFLADQRVETQQRVLVHVSINVNGVDRNNGGQQACRAGDPVDVIAFGEQSSAHSAVNRCAYSRVLEIQPGRIQRRLRGQQ